MQVLERSFSKQNSHQSSILNGEVFFPLLFIGDDVDDFRKGKILM